MRCRGDQSALPSADTDSADTHSADTHSADTGTAGSRTPPSPARVHRLGAALLALTVGAMVLSACAESSTLTTPEGSPISTSTTRIAEVNVVSADRDYARTCLAPTAPDPGQPDVARIVVTDPALLDAVCALGIGPRVTALAGSAPIPAYLGPQLQSVPAIGATPTPEAVAEAAPDVVLATPGTEEATEAFDDTRVVTVDPTLPWQEGFQAVADGLGRTQSAQRLLEEFGAETTATGLTLDAAHTQVSLVRFIGDTEMIAGMDTFGGQILSMIGVQRPEPQRVEQSFTVTDETFKDADGDLIYVSFGEDGLAYGEEVLLSDRWLDMGAPTWNRVLAVDDEVWYRSSGLAAAWLVLNDVKGSLNSSS